MVPNNIEKQINEKLNAREIQPSAQAWDRLDAMLSVAEEKKTRRSFGWLYIAAAVLVFATAGMFLYNSIQTPKDNGVDGVVVNESNNESNKKEASPTSERIQHRPAEVPEKLLPTTTQVAENEKIPSPDKKTDQQHQPVTNQKTTVYPLQGTASNQESIAVNTAKKEDANPPSPKAITANPDAVIAANEAATSKIKVNPNSLLSEVDGELELTFREKVFKKVSKNYKEVKVALANRNLQ